MKSDLNTFQLLTGGGLEIPGSVYGPEHGTVELGVSGRLYQAVIGYLALIIEGDLDCGLQVILPAHIWKPPIGPNPLPDQGSVYPLCTLDR